jgi:hypothetical protein
MSRAPLTRLDTQVVRINADLLHFHSTPSASEGSIGGVDLIGSNAAAQANATNAIMSKGRIISVIYLFSGMHVRAGKALLSVIEITMLKSFFRQRASVRDVSSSANRFHLPFFFARICAGDRTKGDSPAEESMRWPCYPHQSRER